ncbi:DUF6090 family protein [Muricauda sp. SCSIO 64092]|uniref:DUF6090 family protein n=1 Tax=Allomuricauda sp. SCSIO 64092 TaxID=2908842 RepID=UPI001FF523A9|nr:DUF6090 family protein [Muricauda sp. SCSIO 64092]UOY06543.1 DUF6090 family protein [Muricauda sp. SCSIO 64092]
MERNNLKYTLREILIVIIGITIAFSMNKCSDNIKNKRLLKEYMKNIRSDIAMDKEQLAKNSLAIETKITICNQMIQLLNAESEENLELLGMAFEVLKYESFNPENITYRTLINSGDLKLLDDFELKTAIQRHYANYETVQDIYLKHRSLIRDYLGNYMINYADYDKFAKGELPFLDRSRLKNIIRALLTTLNEKKEAAQIGMDSCEALLLVLEQSLD